MRVFESCCAAMFAGVGVLFSWLSLRLGDEPVKPTASASEANPAVPAPGHSVHGEAFNEGPRHAAYLIAGMGKVHFPVTTAKPEAQKFVNQGVAQLHSFLYFESERSFRQAAKLDPGCAMAYWGMAMSNINNPRRAKGVLKEAPASGPRAIVPREQLYLGPSRRSTRMVATTEHGSRVGFTDWRRSSRIPRTTSTPAPGWRW